MTTKFWLKIYLSCVGIAIVVVGLYLAISRLQTDLGFPLDDAWIHQVFARNLEQSGQFAYNPGQVVAGSTSPLWSILLVPGYFFGSEFYKFWAYLLGAVFLGLTGAETYRLYLLIFKPSTDAFPTKEAWAAALFTMLEWHLAWAGSSGMETMLFTFLTLLLLRLYLSFEKRERQPEFKPLLAYGLLGIIGGVLTLVRPEGLVLLGLIALESGRRLLSNKVVDKRIAPLAQRWLAMAIAWLLLVVPYLLFNYASSGSPLPTTFYAKASGYASDVTIGSTLQYWLDAATEILLHSPLIFLLVFAALYALLIIRQAERRKTMGWVDWRLLVWPLVVVLLYSVRLPVTYQHARYLIPILPILILYSVWAMARFRDYLKTVKLRRFARALPIVLALAVVLVWYNGSITYQSDVRIINDEQVQIGQWLNSHTPTNSIVATHDIGAIGYFSHRRIIDTAGLVSTEFIPIVHDETAILQKAKAEGANYFALMPNWYPELDQQLNAEHRLIFEPSQKFLDQFRATGDVMQVFKLK